MPWHRPRPAPQSTPAGVIDVLLCAGQTSGETWGIPWTGRLPVSTCFKSKRDISEVRCSPPSHSS